MIDISAPDLLQFPSQALVLLLQLLYAYGLSVY